MDKNHKELNAVHEKDLEALLEKAGLKNPFLSGQLKCKFCDNVVTINNIYSILPQSGTLNLICDNPECITLLLQYMEERNKAKTQQE